MEDGAEKMDHGELSSYFTEEVGLGAEEMAALQFSAGERGEEGDSSSTAATVTGSGNGQASAPPLSRQGSANLSFELFDIYEWYVIRQYVLIELPGLSYECILLYYT